jgi:hypothetical protein
LPAQHSHAGSGGDDLLVGAPNRPADRRHRNDMLFGGDEADLFASRSGPPSPPVERNRHGPCDVVFRDGLLSRPETTAVAMRINAIDPSIPPATGRSLVSLAPQPPADSGVSRPSAVFLAHLIGAAQGVPQSRARRRLGPADASAAYANAAKQAAAAGRAYGSL